MLKHILFTGAVSASLFCYAQQDIISPLDTITNTEQAKRFIKSNKGFKGKIFTFNVEQHDTNMAKDLFKLSKGNSKVYENEFEKTTYKVIEKEDVMYYRVHYIFINSEGFTDYELKRYKQTIFSKFNQGIPFKNLIQQYSMDKNIRRGGDTGWFTAGTMPAEFEEEVIHNNKNHYINKLFTVDISSKKWHYVILKTEEPKPIEEIKVLKITEAI
ncbi:peptidylprolyl isomerase [Formosa sp. S-31]|uniref:peptidylprolyl isomerase n=1 Tax=Formosa sp. S-31 TaxID=2790949 RepID=UPI003EB847D4